MKEGKRAGRKRPGSLRQTACQPNERHLVGTCATAERNAASGCVIHRMPLVHYAQALVTHSVVPNAPMQGTRN